MCGYSGPPQRRLGFSAGGCRGRAARTGRRHAAAPQRQDSNKTARSTVRSVPYETAASAASYLAERKRHGAYVVALEWTTNSQSLLHYQLPELVRRGEAELIIVPGHEAAGVAQNLLDLADVSVHLPMHGNNSSLNVAVALGSATYLLLRQLPTDQ